MKGKIKPPVGMIVGIVLLMVFVISSSISNYIAMANTNLALAIVNIASLVILSTLIIYSFLRK